MNNELNILAEALSTQGEAEKDGVKYIYMDESTIYRFENNRMKKVSAATIKKAQKLLSTQGNLPNDAKQPKKKATRGKAKKVIPEEPEDNDDEQQEEEEEDDEPTPPPPKKSKKQPAQPKPSKSRTPKVETSANIDLNEYYNNKNRMEFMTMEIDRLTNKVNKLKQYKSIVNKITGGEYEAPDVQYEPQSQYVQQSQYQQESRGGRKINDSIFDF